MSLEEIKKLERMLDELKLGYSQADEEVERLLEKRAELVRKNKRLRAEVRALREELNSERAKLQELREELEKFRVERGRIREERSRLLRELKQLSKRVRGSEEELKSELERLEWIQQTTPLPSKEEEELIRRIVRLEKKLLLHNEVKQLRSMDEEARRRLMEVNEKRREIIEELEATRERIGKLKSEIRERIAQMKENSRAIDEIMKMTMEKAQLADELRRKYREVRERLISLRIQRKLKIAEERETKLMAAEEELFKKAVKKYENNEKLDFWEYYVLVKRGYIKTE